MAQQQALTSKALRETRRSEKTLRKSLGDVGGELSQMWRVLAPWTLLAAALGLAPLAWWLARWGEVQAFTAICIAVAGVVMLYVSLTLTRGRMHLGRAHELFNVSAPVGVVAYTVAYGPDKYVLIASAIFGITSAIVWNRRHTSTAMRELERHGGAGGALPQRWRAFTAEHAPSLVDSTMTVLKDNADELAVGLDLGEAGIPSDVGPLLERVTRFAGGLAGGASLIAGDYLDKVIVRVARRDPLKTAMHWQGPNAPGASMIEPIEGIGRYRDLLDLSLTLPYVAPRTSDGEPKMQSHIGIYGMSRSGKGASGELLDVNIATRSDAILVVCDPVKADQQLGPIEAGADYVLNTAPKIRSFFHRLVASTIPTRAAILGDPTRNRLGRRLREWEPGCGLSWVAVHVYEAAALFNNQDMTKLTERAASVGIEIIVEVQKGIHDRVDTNARSNMAAMLVFGTYDYDDAALVVPPALLELGVNPGAWQNKQPGTCLVVFPELPLARQAVPARFARHAPDGSDIEAALAEYMHLASPCDPWTVATWGEPYQEYRAQIEAKHGRRPQQHAFAGAVLLDERPVPAVSLPTAPRPPAPLPTGPEEGFDLGEPGESEPTAADERAELTEAAEDVVGDMANMLHGDAEAGAVLGLAVDGLERYGQDDDEAVGPLVAADDIEFPPDPDEAHFEPILDRNEAFDVLLAVLRDDVGEGGTFRPSDLYDALDRRARRGDSWVRKELKTLQGWGCVEDAEGYGVYEVRHTRRGDLDDYAESLVLEV
ncbi:hypothetical protein ACQPYK_36265 [Streptosporangium sp. CA-135522]|uniref:hypothetical protein n=1 Tax=Streptosporangium sp. CA-135522 TaxID=3240072 RepID=UPI003D8D0321